MAHEVVAHIRSALLENYSGLPPATASGGRLMGMLFERVPELAERAIHKQRFTFLYGG
jgi:hypothetical protein